MELVGLVLTDIAMPDVIRNGILGNFLLAKYKKCKLIVNKVTLWGNKGERNIFCGQTFGQEDLQPHGSLILTPLLVTSVK